MTPSDAIKAVHMCIVRHPRDWGADSRDAWIWGVIVGWDDESLVELAETHRWSSDDVARLRAMRAAIESLGDVK